jgi:hypothetical protein
MILLSGLTNSAVFVIFGIYFTVNLIALLVLRKLLRNYIKINNNILYWSVLIFLSTIVTFLLLGFITTITGKGLLE